MAIAGGAPIDLCDATVAQTVPGGGSWNRDGVMLFGSRTGVKRVSDSGGSPAAVTTANRDRGEIGHGYPQFLPNGDGFLYFIESGDSNVQGVYASSLRNPGDQKQILRTPGKAVLRGTPGDISRRAAVGTQPDTRRPVVRSSGPRRYEATRFRQPTMSA